MRTCQHLSRTQFSTMVQADTHSRHSDMNEVTYGGCSDADGRKLPALAGGLWMWNMTVSSARELQQQRCLPGAGLWGPKEARDRPANLIATTCIIFIYFARNTNLYILSLNPYTSTGRYSRSNTIFPLSLTCSDVSIWILQDTDARQDEEKRAET